VRRQADTRSIVPRDASSDAAGCIAHGGRSRWLQSVDLGRELARRLRVPAQIVVFDRVAEVVDALKSGPADFTVTNATPALARDVDFTTPAVVGLELGYLSLPGSPVQALADVDGPGVCIGVSQGSSSKGPPQPSRLRGVDARREPGCGGRAARACSER
ncbi:MAG: hypothetical protein ABIQ60_04170, partial [Burkholderiaceae bacterium]